MPLGMDSFPTPCCSGGGNSDLIPLLIVAGIFFVAHVTFKEFKKRKGKPEMKNLKNRTIIVLVVVAVGAIFLIKQNQETPTEATSAGTGETAEAISDTGQVEAPAALPRLLELGADKCVPCKMMVPILEDLRTTYAGQLQVNFIDVWKNPDAGRPYGIRVIPTQIFFDAQGKELFRHEGFFAKEDILTKWKGLGVEFQ